jgi:hypothetical protein
LLAFVDIIEELASATGVERAPVDPRLSALRRAAESLDSNLVPRRQPDVLERFFRHAGAALRRLDGHPRAPGEEMSGDRYWSRQLKRSGSLHASPMDLARFRQHRARLLADRQPRHPRVR